MTTRSKLNPAQADYSHLDPLPDPPREPDMQQFIGVHAFATALMPHFGHRDDVLICGEGFLRHEATNDAERLAPDVVVTFGVNPSAIIARNGYVISEVGKPPDFVLEVASRSTGRRDYTVKREGYAGYGVQEYWRFDHTGGEFHDAALAGDVLVDGRYEPLRIHQEDDGLIWGHSEVLGLDLCWDDGDFRLRNPLTGDYLPRPMEMRAELDTAQAERDAAQAEAARLREELRRLRGD